MSDNNRTLSLTRKGAYVEQNYAFLLQNFMEALKSGNISFALSIKGKICFHRIQQTPEKKDINMFKN